MSDLALEREALRLFEALLDIPSPDRDAWVAAQTPDNPRLADRLAAMMAADRQAALPTGGAVDSSEADGPIPEQIGAYRITERIGRGGMGSVYRGERHAGDFAHVVAIKVIKPGLLAEALVERFHAERQMLASLSHPNIAQLFDGGATSEGAPYIVMEFVHGQPLLQWADDHQASRAERLRLFRDICAAVAFAHRALIVHRDLAPSNVLVTRDGVIKLIDFGIAKPAGTEPPGPQRDGMASIASLSLTPGYAAPERMTFGPVTTMVDIYSLGKLLEKLIPPGPADRELAQIIARATADDPARRYPTAEALGEDVAAWQAGFPVAAMAGGKRYRFAKFVRRHRTGTIVTVAAVLAMLGAFAMTYRAYAQAESARRAEAARFADLRSLAAFMLFDLEAMLERVAGNAEARGRLADRAQSYLSALAESPGADESLRLEAARGFVRLALIQGVPGQPNLGRADQARRNLDTALRLAGSLTTIAPTTRAELLADTLGALAMVQMHIDNDSTAAEASLRQAERVLADVPATARGQSWHRARRHLRHTQLDLSVAQQNIAAMTRLADLVEREIDQWPERRPRDAAFDRAMAALYRGYRGYFTDELASAVAATQDAQRRLVALDQERPNDPLVLYRLMWVGYVGYGAASGLPDQAAQADRFLQLARTTSQRVLEIEPHDNSVRAFAAGVDQIEAQALAARGQFREALTLQRRVVSLHDSALGKQRRTATLNRLVVAHVTLGNIALQAEGGEAACPSYRAAWRTVAELLAKDALIGTAKTYHDGIRENIERCDRAAPPEIL